MRHVRRVRARHPPPSNALRRPTSNAMPRVTAQIAAKLLKRRGIRLRDWCRPQCTTPFLIA